MQQAVVRTVDDLVEAQDRLQGLYDWQRAQRSEPPCRWSITHAARAERIHREQLAFSQWVLTFAAPANDAFFGDAA